MKKLTHLFFILITLSTYAQTSKKTLNYQAVILDPNAIDIPGASITGQPLNKGKVCLRFSLLNAQGGLDYEETQQVTTDEFGLVSVAIGAGSQTQTGNSTSIYKSFESVQWNANMKSLKVSVSFDGCSSFKQVSTQIFNYTPYALYAEAVDYKNVREAPTKLSQFSNDAGFLIPKDLDPLKTDIKTNSNQIATANQTITENKQASDAAFLVVNQSLTSLDEKVAGNTSSITKINTKLTDQQNQISDNRNQIAATNSTMNAQIGGLQAQINSTNNTVSNLTGVAEMQSNKSTAADLGGANPSDQTYPSQKATKTYVDQVVAQISSGTISDATTVAAGKIQLAGDLGGTATNPTVPALATKENTANKSTNVQADGTNNTKYPSVKAVKDYVDQATLGTALAADLAAKANLASPTFTGTPTAPTPASSDNSTKIATTAFVQAATAGIALQASVDAKANINSPTFTGSPVLPSGTTGVTQSSGDNSTKLATTAYVDAQVASGAADATSSSRGIVQLTGDLGGTATSPSVLKLRGTPISSVAPTTAGHVLTYDVNGNATWAAPANSANTISGVVPVANGGTGLSSVTSGGAVYASSSSALTTGTLPLTAGGTGAISQQSAINALTGTQSAGKYLRSDGTDATLSAIQAADVPTLNQNTTGTASNVTGTVAVANGGTGQTSIAGIQSTLGLAGTKVAIGSNAGQNSQGAQAVAVGYAAGQNSQGSNSVSLGGYASSPYSNSTAIGYQAVTSAANTIQLGADGVSIAGSTAITNVKTSGTLTAGTVTYPNTHGTANQVLTTTGSGTLTWTTPSSGSSNTHSVGESYGGGVVFYTWDNGAHGLIVSLTDQCCNSSTPGKFSAGTATNTLAYNGSGGASTTNQTAYTTITGGGVGAGKKNTLLILASQGLGNGVKYAARYANEYSIISNGVLYDDWYLGSVDEYHLLANNYDQVLANNSFTPLSGPNKDYWTSTEINSTDAFTVYIRTNSTTSNIFNVFPNAKSMFNSGGYGNVRAIRSF